MTFEETAALSNLAAEAGVHYQPFEPDFPRNTSDRLYKQYGVRIPPERVLELAVHYREIYKFTSSIKQEYFHPHHRITSAPEDYDLERLQARMADQFPEDAPEVLFSVMHRVILFEYLL
jgi:hypothetical protein